MATFSLCVCGQHGKFVIAEKDSAEFPACRPVLFKEIDHLKTVGDISHTEASEMKTRIANDPKIAGTEVDFFKQVVGYLREWRPKVSGDRMHLNIMFIENIEVDPAVRQRLSDEYLTELARHPVAQA